MMEAKIMVVPCRSDMPLAGMILSALAEQFPGLVEVAPPPEVPESLAVLLKPPGDNFRAHFAAVIVLVDSACLKTRPGFVRTLLESSRADDSIVVVADHPCELRLRELLPRRVGQEFVCGSKLRGVVSLLLRRLEHSTYPGEQRGLRAECGLEGIVGESQYIIELKQRLPAIAGSEESVLITGETGVGKEVVAHAIHYLSPRRDKPFVPVHCGAVPSDLFENEFFGHNPGAYTGAQGEQKGFVAQASHGTLFLDEISTLSLSNQAKLLRVLQEGEYRPLGGGNMIRADIRVLAASNSDLDAAVKQNIFRGDLLYRINSIVIEIPPLRCRREDIHPLACHFLHIFAGKYRKGTEGLSPLALAQLEGYEWPGNVRELEHIIGQAVLFSSGPEITEFTQHHSAGEDTLPLSAHHAARNQALEEFERGFLTRAIQKAGGNLSQAARLAGLDRSHLVRLLRKYNIRG